MAFNNMLAKLACFFVFLVLVGCSNTPTQTVDIKLPNNIKYIGNGSAGFALMSVMGPTGVAVGAAIDVGIANDIKNMNEPSALQSELNSLITEYNAHSLIDNPINKLQITRIDFIALPDDLVKVKLTGTAKSLNSDLFNLSDCDIKEELVAIKTKKGLANFLIVQAVEFSLKEIKRERV